MATYEDKFWELYNNSSSEYITKIEDLIQEEGLESVFFITDPLQQEEPAATEDDYKYILERLGFGEDTSLDILGLILNTLQNSPIVSYAEETFSGNGYDEISVTLKNGVDYTVQIGKN